MMSKRIKFVLIAAAGAIVALAALWLTCLPRNPFASTPYSTVVEDRSGNLLGAKTASDGQWRFPPSDTIPDKFVKALVLYEDKNFYSHGGVDLKAVARAARQNRAAGHVVSGASTISMQVIRLSRQKQRTLPQKAIEAFLATRLESRYTKDEILALFAAHAPFGGNVVGLEAASWRYFSAPAEDLSWAQAAMLAVLPNSPSMIHPGKNRDRLLSKRNSLLERLYLAGEMDQSDYLEAISEPLPAAPHPMPQHAPHQVEHYNLVRSGERVRTGMDLYLQIRVKQVAEQWSSRLADQGIADLSVVVMDVESGDVLAYVGNSFWESSKNGAKVDIGRSGRSTGSVLKPFLYEAAIDRGVILPRTLLVDIPTNLGGFTPKNFDMNFSGAVPADRALARSLNVPMVRLLKDYGVALFYDRLKALGMSTLYRSADDYGLSLILGGAEGTLLDLSRMYRDLALRALDGDLASCYTVEALSGLTRPDEMDSDYITSLRKIAWKTGTSFGFRDAWAIGMTPSHVVAVWAGNAEGQGVSTLIGGRVAAPVMFDIFSLLPQDRLWFPTPDSQKGVYLETCRESGYLAGPYCEARDTLCLPAASEHTDVCPYHKMSDGRAVFVLPPVVEYYYRQSHPQYEGAATPGSRAPMEFIYPQQGARILVPRQMDGTRKGFVAKIAHSDPHTTIFWHLDKNYLGQTSVIHQIQINGLLPGHHILSAVDSSGRSVSVGFDTSE